jgi:hypothetical protein
MVATRTMNTPYTIIYFSLRIVDRTHSNVRFFNFENRRTPPAGNLFRILWFCNYCIILYNLHFYIKLIFRLRSSAIVTITSSYQDYIEQALNKQNLLLYKTFLILCFLIIALIVSFVMILSPTASRIS